MGTILNKKDPILLYFLLTIVYLSGLWIPLMENDSAQHATMAMRMYLEDDFWNIIKAGNDYLDKPHMHFWLAGFSFKIFGVSQWAYRIPAMLFTLIGAISCYNLAVLFYRKNAGHIAALAFLSSQAILLANHDVRTDAVLTGATIFGIWQLVAFIKSNKLIHIILGAIGVAIAFSTKGQLAVFISGTCILCYLAYERKWKILWSWKILIGVLTFAIAISPVLYAYYLQFDLHPEKVIHGQSNISGVRFILWDQSFNRLTASGFEQTSPDYFFFFHTLLWAFLPWSLMAYVVLYHKIKTLWHLKFQYQKGIEILTSIGFLAVMIVISFSKFKLPHYLNSLLPILSILIAGYIVELFENRKIKTTKHLLYIQYFILTLGSLFVLFWIFWAFPMPHVGIILCYVLLIISIVYVISTKIFIYRKLILISVLFMVLINFCLNTQFYPKLLLYQAGNNAAKIIQAEKIDKKDVFMLNGKPSWSLDFYTGQITPKLDIIDAQDKLENGTWLFAYEAQKVKLEKQNIKWSELYTIYHHRITRLTAKFLNPNTRDEILEKAYLLKIQK